MIQLRNPFRLQTSESIDTEAAFLRLFGPAVLDLLPKDAISGRALFIRSAPGGGKTSLLRLFTPSVLMTLLRMSSSEPFREIYGRLLDLQTVEGSLPRVIGIMLSCRRTFPDLHDLGLPDAKSRRLLHCLLDARIILGALRSALIVNGLRFPDDLRQVNIDDVGIRNTFAGLEMPCDGVSAAAWAEGLERSVCDFIDSLEPDALVEVQGHEEIDSLGLLERDAITVAGKKLGMRWLVMLDDLHKLTTTQRDDLVTTLIEQRSGTSIWIAERLEALSLNELFASGALDYRDYLHPILLEEAWRDRKKAYESAMATVAERRVQLAVESVPAASAIGSFLSFVESGDRAQDSESVVSAAIITVRDRISKLVAAKGNRYSGWVDARASSVASTYEHLIRLRVLEILIERDLRKTQLSFEFELTEEALDHQDDSPVRAAAELFISTEFHLPYYFGKTALTSMSSFNVEQFLRLAGDLFEQSLSSVIMKRSPSVSPLDQERLLKKACEIRLAELPNRTEYGRDILDFIDAVGQSCHDETHRPSAPYAPGVSGIAISMREREMLSDEDFLERNPMHRRFSQMLAASVANNVFQASNDYKVKGGSYMVLYLNRLICPKYQLPLHYGGFREKSLSEFVLWLERGYRGRGKRLM